MKKKLRFLVLASTKVYSLSLHLTKEITCLLPHMFLSLHFVNVVESLTTHVFSTSMKRD